MAETLLVSAVTLVAGSVAGGIREGVNETQHFILTELYLRKSNVGETGFTPREEKILRKLGGKSL